MDTWFKGLYILLIIIVTGFGFYFLVTNNIIGILGILFGGYIGFLWYNLIRNILE